MAKGIQILHTRIRIVLMDFLGNITQWGRKQVAGTNYCLWTWKTL